MKRSKETLSRLEDICSKLDHGCKLQKSDGGFRMVDWMSSVGSLYKNALCTVRKFEQNGKRVGVYLLAFINYFSYIHPFFCFWNQLDVFFVVNLVIQCN